MSRFLRHPVSAGARLRPGRSSAGLTALRGLHLDTACAPALTWQLAGNGTITRSARSECPRFQGNRAVPTDRSTPANTLAVTQHAVMRWCVLGYRGLDRGKRLAGAIRGGLVSHAW